MADVQHGAITVAQGIHPIQKYEVADSTARLALSSPPAGAVVRQTDNDSVWLVLTTAPTFARLDDPELGGDLSGTAGSATVAKIQGTAVDAASPTDAQIFIYDGSVDNEWEPKSLSGDVTITRDGVATVAQLQGQAVESGTPNDGDVLTWSTSNSQWEHQASNSDATSIQGAAVDAATPTDGQILIYDGTLDNEWEPKSLSGDGSLSNAGAMTVTGIQGRTVLQGSTPGAGDIYVWNATSSRWEHKSITGDFSLTEGGVATVTAIQGAPVIATTPTDAQLLIYDDSAGNDRWEPKSLSGDVTINREGAATIGAIKGDAIESGNPVNAEIMIYDATDLQWEFHTFSGDATINRSGGVSVTGIRGDSVQDIGTPTDGDGLVWDSGSSHYAVTKVQTKQKLAYNIPFFIEPAGKTDNTYYGPVGLTSTKYSISDFEQSYGSTGSPGDPVTSAVDYPNAKGILVPQTATITRVFLSIAFFDASPVGTNNAHINLLIVTPNYGTDRSTTQVLVNTTSGGEVVEPDTTYRQVEVTLNNTSVSAGDIIVPVIAVNDISDTGTGPVGHFAITLEAS